jgi:hypothetical protein
MPSFRALLDAGGRSLARHLDRLRHTLDTLGQRLRDALAHAVGQAVAGAVQEAVHVVLANRPSPARPVPFDRPRAPPALSWEEPAEPPWPDEADGRAQEDWGDEPLPQPASSPRQPQPRSFGRALLVGCETAAWWLRRQAGRGTAWAALGLGLAAAVAVLAGGPLAAAGLGLAGTALGLLGLADAARAGVAALATLGTSGSGRLV